MHASVVSSALEKTVGLSKMLKYVVSQQYNSSLYTDTGKVIPMPKHHTTNMYRESGTKTPCITSADGGDWLALCCSTHGERDPSMYCIGG